jgi:hypothetical protein
MARSKSGTAIPARTTLLLVAIVCELRCSVIAVPSFVPPLGAALRPPYTIERPAAVSYLTHAP